MTNGCREFSVMYVIFIIIITYNYTDSVFKEIYNKIDKDVKEYLKCKRNENNILICGRNKTKYTFKKIKNKPHISYISISITRICKIHNIVKCSNEFILIGILTRPECIYERIVSRKIFQHIDNVKFLFISGLSTNIYINKLLYKEIIKFNDIIVFNVINSYYNCSIIMSCFYIYMYSNCENIKWVIKLDIDTYLNMKLLLKVINYSNRNISVIGKINKNPRIKCNSNYKWSVRCLNKSIKFIPTPPYPFGPGFVFKFSSISCIYSYFNKNKSIIWIEDIFFGILMNYCNLKYLDITNFTEITYKPKYNLSITKTNIFVHGLHPIEIYLASKEI